MVLVLCTTFLLEPTLPLFFPFLFILCVICVWNSYGPVKTNTTTVPTNVFVSVVLALFIVLLYTYKYTIWFPFTFYSIQNLLGNYHSYRPANSPKLLTISVGTQHCLYYDLKLCRLPCYQHSLNCYGFWVGTTVPQKLKGYLIVPYRPIGCPCCFTKPLLLCSLCLQCFNCEPVFPIQ